MVGPRRWPWRARRKRSSSRADPCTARVRDWVAFARSRPNKGHPPRGQSPSRSATPEPPAPHRGPIPRTPPTPPVRWASPPVVGGATPPVVGADQSGMSGCAKAAISRRGDRWWPSVRSRTSIFFFVRRGVDNVEEAVGESPCVYISSEEASEILGSQVDAWSGDSVLGQILGVIQDTRLLSDSPSCFLSSEDSSVQMWISVYDGGRRGRCVRRLGRRRRRAGGLPKQR